MENCPRAIRVVRSLESPCLGAAPIITAQGPDVNLVHIDFLGCSRTEVVRHGKRQVFLRDKYTLRIASSHIVVVEEIDRLGGRIRARERRRGIYTLMVRVGRGEVLGACGDRAVAGETLHGEVVSVEVNRHAARDRERSVNRLIGGERVVRADRAVCRIRRQRRRYANCHNRGADHLCFHANCLSFFCRRLDV